jgi:hypothetical protein
MEIPLSRALRVWSCAPFFEQVISAEEIMRQNLCICILVFGAALPALHASSVAVHSKQYLQATILSVQREELEEASRVGDNPSDTPSRSQAYAYDVVVRVSCGTYVGHYESPYDYLPSAFSPNRQVQVRLTKHVMYFNLPGDREMEMNIVRHQTERGVSCATSAANR